MPRGKPFKTSLSRLVAAGVVRKPIWMDVVEATRPPFEPVAVTKVPKITYPEDRLRSVYLTRNPAARRLPVNLNARTIPERHVADKFVTIQMRLMKEQSLSEDDAYNAAEKLIEDEKRAQQLFFENILEGPLTDMSIQDQTARLYMASVNDSRRDQTIFETITASNTKVSDVHLNKLNPTEPDQQNPDLPDTDISTPNNSEGLTSPARAPNRAPAP